MKKYILIFEIIIIYLLMSCAGVGGGPNDGSAKNTVKIEYDWMSGETFSAIAGYYDIPYYIKFAFSKVEISYWQIKEQYPVDSYKNWFLEYFPQQTAPSVDIFPDDDSYLRLYAKYYDNENLDWHILTLDSFEDINAMGRSADLTNGVNISPTPIVQRYSMVFIENIKDYYSEDDEVKATVTTAVHELGHQIGGLTHPTESDYYQYHYSAEGPTAFTDYCVMAYGYPVTITPEFCNEMQEIYIQVSNCKQNLLNNL